MGKLLGLRGFYICWKGLKSDITEDITAMLFFYLLFALSYQFLHFVSLRKIYQNPGFLPYFSVPYYLG